jgi:cytochrome P450
VTLLERIVVVGASQAGCGCAAELRRLGFEGSITVVGDESHLPYARPPLSKGVLIGAEPEESVFLPLPEGVEMLRSISATGLDASRHLDLLEDGSRLPYPYRRLREAGPVVYLERFDLFAVARFAEVRHVLGNWESFSSADVPLNRQFNEYMSASILRADPPQHDVLRGVLAEKLARPALRALAAGIEQRAHEIVDGLVAKGSFDAVRNLARRFPVEIVGDLIGLPAAGRESLLPFLDISFNCFGPDNDRTRESLPQLGKLVDYVVANATRETLAEGSMGRAVYDAADAGVISPEHARALLMAYVTGGMDTTVHSLGHCVWLLGRHPEHWQLLREDPALIPQAFREILRFESPIQAFGRTVRSDWTVEDVTVPAGSRLAILYGCANRDERNWPDADVFDITRDNLEHLSFGYGLHGCAGQALARLEGEAVLRALVDTVAQIKTGEPMRHYNNVLRGLESLPVTVVAAPPRRSQL